MVSLGSDPFHAAAGFTGGKKRVPPEMADQQANMVIFRFFWGQGMRGATNNGKKNNYEQKWIYMVNLIYTYEHNTFLAGACIDFTIDSKDKSTS